MRNLIHLEWLSLNVATLSGPLPDFSRSTLLANCDFTPSQLCVIPELIPADSECDISGLPDCGPILDCVILTEWLPRMFDVYTCCLAEGVTCEEDRAVILDLSSTNTGKKIFGIIPISNRELDKLQKLYLQDNIIGGNLPLSMSNISSLQTVNISNNFLSGVLPFALSFELIGIESNLGLSLPIDLSTRIDLPTETPDLYQNINEDKISLPLIVGISAGLILFVLLVIAVVILFKRREQGKETEIELRLLPKYSSTNKQIRLIRMLNSGGFGVVWKARNKGQTVAIKLIRMDKHEGKEYDNERNVKIFKMVVDEASIMELMVHERVVRFVMFELESLGIVLEYLPLGSLYDYIANSKRVMPWMVRYQMMLDICQGMEFLHSKVYPDGSLKKVLFHQDLKSANVLMCMEGSPPSLRGKVSDFGLSCKFLFLLTFASNPINRKRRDSIKFSTHEKSAIRQFELDSIFFISLQLEKILENRTNYYLCFNSFDEK
jgi:hypothetical protein